MPSREEQIGKLALRFQGANAANDEAEEARLRLLIEDTAELSLTILERAIKAGVKHWKFMPAAADIFVEAKFFRDMERVPTFDTPALPAPQPLRLSDNTDADQLLRDTIAALKVGNAKMMGGTVRDEPAARLVSAGPARSPTADDYAALRSTIRPAHGGASDALKAMVNGA